MISKNSTLRIARPTDNLSAITAMYTQGLGFELLSTFYDHDGFNGSILGHSPHSYHLEFTHHIGTLAGRAPTQDNLLIFYIPEIDEWIANCNSVIEAGFKHVKSYNPYWDVAGKTFEDVDGYRIVLQNGSWGI